MGRSSPDGGDRNHPTSLDRASKSWTGATSAAGFTLRYLMPLRRQLIEAMGSEAEADEALKLLLGHLVTAGFGKRRRGRLRDFLNGAVGSAARARWQQQSESLRTAQEPTTPGNDSAEWLRLWRDGLLERAWRSLERHEHASPESPLYSVLHAAARMPQASPQMIAARIASETELKLGPQQVAALLPQARAVFAQLLADEITGTLDNPTRQDVRDEIQTLDLASAFVNLPRQQGPDTA